MLQIIVLMFFFTLNAFATSAVNPCANVSVLSQTDRGSVTNTPCVMPSNTFLLETGYQYKHFTIAGYQQAYPQSSVFIGLPANSELQLTLPSYNQQSIRPFSGASATTVGVKHELFYGQSWVTAGSILLAPPGGSATFGSDGLGMSVNGIFSYNIHPKVSTSFLLGWSTSTLPSFFRGERYNSMSSSFLLSYVPIEKLSIFIEVFAQSRTAPGVDGNYNADCGMLYLLSSNIVIDFELGQQLGHEPASFNQFIGGGVSVKL